MDIVAHTLWTAGVALPARRRVPLSLSWAIFWGVFPDLFSFAIPAAVRIWWYVSGTTSSLMPGPNGPQPFQFVWQLYYASHSLLVFAIAFGIAWLIAGRPIFAMLAWCLHILIDIPTHQGIFALHFLWPVSSYGFSGIRWENHWFVIVNYSALSLLYLWLWIRARRGRSVEGSWVESNSSPTDPPRSKQTSVSSLT